MSAIDIFQYQGHEVRTVIVDGEPWFVAADVARVLGYRMASDMTRRLDDDEKGTQKTRTPSGDQNMAVINEPGLYAAILRSSVPQAREFKRWVTHDVLPEIRRTGQFGSKMPATFAEALELAALELRRVEALEAKVAEDAPKVEAFNELMDAEGYYTMNAVAKLCGTGRTRLYGMLRSKGIIQTGSTEPYQRYMHLFKLTTSTYKDSLNVTHVTTTTRVRPEGLSFILRKLGFEPIPELAAPDAVTAT